MKIRIDQISPNPEQPRRTFHKAELQELAESIKENGLVQAIVVERRKDGYILIAGERRLRACKLLGLKEIDADIHDANHKGRDRLLLALVENLQRSDMDIVEEAQAYQALGEKYDLSVPEIGRKVGKAASRIYQVLAVLKLEPEIQQLLASRRLPHQPDVITALLTIKDGTARVGLARRAVQHQLKAKTIIHAAESMAAALASEPMPRKRRSKSPSISLAAERSEVDCDDAAAPPRWDAIKQMGVVPAWGIVVKCSTETCDACELRSMANREICGRCPLVDNLSRMMEAAK